jgi:hypothetical protein
LRAGDAFVALLKTGGTFTASLRTGGAFEVLLMAGAFAAVVVVEVVEHERMCHLLSIKYIR